MTDYDFRQIVGKPDNVPIVAMLFIVGFFTWLYFRRAVDNDERIAAGRPLSSRKSNEKVLVWPDLVYTELICMVAADGRADRLGRRCCRRRWKSRPRRSKTPNPSKAPWYFLGLQEMLVYYDPWMAGVVLPSMILVRADGHSLHRLQQAGQRLLHVQRAQVRDHHVPVRLPAAVGRDDRAGTFLRGPNWNFFGIYEYWDVHKLEVLNNVNLSDMVWIDWARTVAAESAERHRRCCRESAQF